MTVKEKTHSVECYHCGGDHKDWNCPHDIDRLHDEVATGEYRRNQESPFDYSPDYDWSEHDFDNDPEWR